MAKGRARGGTDSSESSRVLDADTRAGFVEEMGLLWQQLGEQRMKGRVLGYLMLSNAPYVSSAELCDALRASPGSISTSTRSLAESGFIRRVAVPGERGHFYRADEDVWGTFLAGERRYMDDRIAYAEHVLATLGPDDEEPRRRLSNMRDYFNWLKPYHRKMLEDWEEFKRSERDE
jgi:DNA-binding transcriptional regulator GbsR (MarR family)